MSRRLPSASPRPDRFDETEPADRSAADDQPARWSRDNLRQRLERLPPGHPSSLPSDDPDFPSPEEQTEPDHENRPETEPDRQADAAREAFWSEVPRFLQVSADHMHRWPADQVKVAVDRSQDPPGSWRGDGGQYLNPELHGQTKEEIARVQQADKGLTPRIGETERDNAYGGWLEGLDRRLKGEERLKEKIAEKIEHEPDRTPAEAIREINDAIRYTFCFESGSYVRGYWNIKQRLEEGGYRMIYSKNHWHDDPEYKGINTRWVTSEGQRFEVQFHTAESFYAKQNITHDAYERSRNPLIGRSERREIEVFQREVCSFIPVPDEVDGIPDYKEDD